VVDPVEKDLDDLKAAAQGLKGVTFEGAPAGVRGQSDAVRSGARRIASRSNEFGSIDRLRNAGTGEVVSFHLAKVGFSCYDPTLAPAP
jgi:hypothetical protein